MSQLTHKKSGDLSKTIATICRRAQDVERQGRKNTAKNLQNMAKEVMTAMTNHHRISLESSDAAFAKQEETARGFVCTLSRMDSPAFATAVIKQCLTGVTHYASAREEGMDSLANTLLQRIDTDGSPKLKKNLYETVASDTIAPPLVDRTWTGWISWTLDGKQISPEFQTALRTARAKAAANPKFIP